MSNQFSYELDERQIRIMLRDGEVEYDGSAWSRFEQLAQPDAKPKSSSFSPKLNISISRSVLVPAVFVILIGGLSAILFSFVDFKKKEVTVTKNSPVINTPDASAQAVIQPSVSSVPAEKPAGIQTEQLTTTPVSTIQTTINKPTEPSQTTHTPEVRPAETLSEKANIPTVVTVTNSNTQPSVQPVVKKRKPKNVVSEEIPTINTSSTNLNQTSQEPELELR